MRKFTALLAVVSWLFLAQEGRAASLQVSPVSVDLVAPAQTSSFRLINNGERPINTQVRVYKWVQVDGEDQLIPTRDVVASPPAVTLQPATAYTIRLARTAAPVIAGEESYRLLVDELPEVNVNRPSDSVRLLVRYSIPVFFSDRGAATKLHWKVHRDGTDVVVVATNTGNRHAKIVNLSIGGSAGRLSFGEGLNGYVLAGSSKHWRMTTDAPWARPGTPITIAAEGDDYAVDHAATIEGH